MNGRGSIIGGLLGAAVAVSITVGLQFVVWGNHAPSWYAAVALLVGMVCGSAGVLIGGAR